MEHQPRQMSPETYALYNRIVQERALEVSDPILKTIIEIGEITKSNGSNQEDLVYLSRKDKNKVGFDSHVSYRKGDIMITEWVPSVDADSTFAFKTTVRYRSGEFLLGVSKKFISEEIIESLEIPEKSDLFPEVEPAKFRQTEDGILLVGPIDGLYRNTIKFTLEFLTRAKEELSR